MSFRSRRQSTGARDFDSEYLNAVREGELEAVREALKHGANMNVQDAMGQTALHIAAYNGNTDVVEFLVLHGVDAAIEANDGLTAYQLALAEDEKECARIIRHRTRDLKVIERGHRRESQEIHLRELQEKVEKKQQEEAEKQKKAASVAMLGRVALQARRAAVNARRNHKAVQQAKETRRVAKYALRWKDMALGEKGRDMDTSVVLSDGKGMRSQRLETIMMSAVEAFADGVGGLGRLHANQEKGLTGMDAAGKVARRMTQLFALRRKESQVANGAAGAGGGGLAAALHALRNDAAGEGKQDGDGGEGEGEEEEEGEEGEEGEEEDVQEEDPVRGAVARMGGVVRGGASSPATPRSPPPSPTRPRPPPRFGSESPRSGVRLEDAATSPSPASQSSPSSPRRPPRPQMAGHRFVESNSPPVNGSPSSPWPTPPPQAETRSETGFSTTVGRSPRARRAQDASPPGTDPREASPAGARQRDLVRRGGLTLATHNSGEGEAETPKPLRSTRSFRSTGSRSPRTSPRKRSPRGRRDSDSDDDSPPRAPFGGGPGVREKIDWERRIRDQSRKLLSPRSQRKGGLGRGGGMWGSGGLTPREAKSFVVMTPRTTTQGQDGEGMARAFSFDHVSVADDSTAGRLPAVAMHSSDSQRSSPRPLEESHATPPVAARREQDSMGGDRSAGAQVRRAAAAEVGYSSPGSSAGNPRPAAIRTPAVSVPPATPPTSPRLGPSVEAFATLTDSERRQLSSGEASEGSIAADRAVRLAAAFRASYGREYPEFNRTMQECVRGGARGAATFGATTVRLWLGALCLSQYADGLINAGFDTMERISLLEDEDLEVLADPSEGEAAVVLKPGHRRQLVEAVDALRAAMDEHDMRNMALLDQNAAHPRQ